MAGVPPDVISITVLGTGRGPEPAPLQATLRQPKGRCVSSGATETFIVRPLHTVRSYEEETQ